MSTKNTRVYHRFIGKFRAMLVTNNDLLTLLQREAEPESPSTIKTLDKVLFKLSEAERQRRMSRAK